MTPDYSKALEACYAYHRERNTVGSLLLFMEVQIMHNDWLNYIID
jgi:hypothetical protein